ncbi:RNA polymerase sigma factor [Maribacter confluentis]|uniref:RNA polymerase sigma factor n=1 Tax=Maribacter confluentis TaxID=1656093 RepID=A0ABT8RLM4_9FLAO|nr:RNA polymerase sigma factor [Maribacter confluentis]MDO1511367.1 RNA polymerase sigma factor [Maribacter confluentis]
MMNKPQEPLIAEETLVQELKTQNTQAKAFEVLVSTYKERLYWQIRGIVLNHDDADDVLQNTFIKIYKNIDGFKGDSQLFSWMYRIATNEALSFIKQRAKIQGLNDVDYQEKLVANLQSDVYFEGNEIQLKLQKAIATLPEKQKLVFNMKYFQELKYEQISEILETTVGGLKASYHLAVKKVEQFLKED